MANQGNQQSPFDQADSHRTLALEVEGRKFWVPRDTMAIHSPVFKEMLNDNCSDANQNAIPLPGKKAKDVEEVLRCLIPSPVCKEIDWTNLETILKFADEYQIEELHRLAESFLATIVDKCEKSDTQLLYILPIAANRRMKKILKACLDRCVDEFGFDKLLPIFKDVPEQVKAYLALGRSARDLESGSGQKSQPTSRPGRGQIRALHFAALVCDDFEYEARSVSVPNNRSCKFWPRLLQLHGDSFYKDCAMCGEKRCSVCNPCNCKANIDEVKKALLDSM